MERRARTPMEQLVRMAREFFEDPANIAAFEEWKAKGKPPIGRQAKRMDGSESAPEGVLERSLAR